MDVAARAKEQSVAASACLVGSPDAILDAASWPDVDCQNSRQDHAAACAEDVVAHEVALAKIPAVALDH